MQAFKRFTALLMAFGGTLGMASTALSVPYASGVRNTGGTNWEFVLNEPADIVTITRDGGNPIVISNADVGRHMFDMMSFSDFEISVSKEAPLGWTELSDPANLFTRFERPVGLGVNQDPSSPFFGTIYVGQSTNLTTAEAGGGTIPARTMAEGIYALTADRIGVDLSNNFMAVADPQSTAQSKKPAAWVTDDTPGTGGTGASLDNSRSPWRFTLDEGGNLIVADWSTSSGGIKWISPDLTQGGPLLAIQDGELDGGFPVRNSLEDDLHSRVQSIYATGRIGQDLTVYGIDSLMQANIDAPATDQRNLWRWNVGNHDFTANPDGYDGTDMGAQQDFIVPDLVINGQELNRIHGPAQTQVSGATEQWFHNIPAVLGDSYYSPQHDLWYLTQPRSDGSQASLLIVDANLDADPTGNTPIVLFNSREWTRDHGLDGAVGVAVLGGPDPETGREGEDVFRMSGTVEISPDGSVMYLRRQQVVHVPTQPNTNPVLGRDSNVPWNVLAIPLDQDGLPILEIDDMGTPADTTDDRISNLTGFDTASPTAAPANHEIALDAAGNIYTTHSGAEVLQVFSPGGSWTAITTSDGMFMLVPFEPPVGLPGDFSGNGSVENADLTLLLDNWGQPVPPVPAGWVGAQPTAPAIDNDELTALLDNWGASAEGAIASASVPEPGAIALVLLALGIAGAVRRR